MSYSETRQIIYDYINANYVGDVQYPNTPFTIPSSGKWIRLNFVDSTRNQMSIGSTKDYRQRFILVINIFTELDVGVDTGLTIADDLITLFAGKTINNKVVVKNCRLKTIGSDGTHYQHVLEIDCYKNEVV